MIQRRGKDGTKRVPFELFPRPGTKRDRERWKTGLDHEGGTPENPVPYRGRESFTFMTLFNKEGTVLERHNRKSVEILIQDPCLVIRPFNVVTIQWN